MSRDMPLNKGPSILLQMTVWSYLFKENGPTPVSNFSFPRGLFEIVSEESLSINSWYGWVLDSSDLFSLTNDISKGILRSVWTVVW